MSHIQVTLRGELRALVVCLICWVRVCGGRKWSSFVGKVYFSGYAAALALFTFSNIICTFHQCQLCGYCNARAYLEVCSMCMDEEFL